MDKSSDTVDSLPGTPAEAPAARAAALADCAAPGHFDELRGRAHPSRESLAPAWTRFFDHLGAAGLADLNRSTANLQRQVRDNGITYNVYADAHGPQRPWSLDLFPLMVAPDAWRRIEAGVLQRVALLDRILADVYGPQELLARNLLPPALVQGHPGYLRAMRGVQPPGGSRLHIAAFDLARDAQGAWWVVSQRTQAPSGLGYLLENRLIVSRLFPQAFRDLRVQRLAGTYRAFADALRAMCPQPEPRLVLLTPGPYNETYFEHAYLARHLGLTLAEGSDLTVRGERLFLKTLQGLQPVHGILKRLDDEFLDPLELRSDSRLGVPGLMQAVRAGHVMVANAPGSAFLESTGILGFLPAISRHLLGQELQLPSLPTWWCGERAALDDALPRLASVVIKPTYAGAGARAVLGQSLSRRELDEWAGRILREPDEHTVQAWLPLAQMPTWTHGMEGDRIVPRSYMLRVFAVADGPRSWRVLPGGLTRLAGAAHEIVAMQRGGSSADTWVLTDGDMDTATLAAAEPAAAPASQAGSHAARAVTSRAGENLFWLGRYTERTENTARLARLTLDVLGGEGPGSAPLLAWLAELCRANALVWAAVPHPAQARRVFERSLIAALADIDKAASVGFNLRALRNAASGVRERLSLQQWNMIVRAEREFFRGCAIVAEDGDFSAVEASRLLEQLSGATAAITGAQIDRMPRDDGWRLLSVGRQIERLGFLASALAAGFGSGAVHDEGGLEAIVALFDSTIAFHGPYPQRRDVAALVESLVLDADNPRSLACVAKRLREGVGRLPGAGECAIADPRSWSPQELRVQAEPLLRALADAAYDLSDDIVARYFTHSQSRHSVGA